MNRINRIIRCEIQADSHAREEQELRWEAAQLVSEELASGTSQRALAEAMHKSQPHVSRMNAAWERYARVSPRPLFSEAYNAANPRGEHKPKVDAEAKSTSEKDDSDSGDSEPASDVALDDTEGDVSEEDEEEKRDEEDEETEDEDEEDEFQDWSEEDEEEYSEQKEKDKKYAKKEKEEAVANVAHLCIRKMHAAASQVKENEAMWPHINQADIARMDQTVEMIDAIREGIERCTNTSGSKRPSNGQRRHQGTG